MRRPPYLPIITVLLVAFGVVGLTIAGGNRPAEIVVTAMSASAPNDKVTRRHARMQEAAFAGCICEQRGGKDCWRRFDEIVGPEPSFGATACDPISTQSICVGAVDGPQDCVVTAYRPNEQGLPPICTAEDAANLEAGFLKRLRLMDGKNLSDADRERISQSAFRWFADETRRVAAGKRTVAVEQTGPSCISG